MDKKQKKRIDSFVRYIFKENKSIISINITATSKKSRSRYAKGRIGSRVSGFSFRRRDFIKKETDNE